MIIAFEGPDKAGKSTSAANVDSSGTAIYNATATNYAVTKTALRMAEPDTVVAFDRIDWLTHMAYRLSLPSHEWNDERVRTVFSMPDTHLVFKIHTTGNAAFIDDELYETGKVGLVNEFYHNLAIFLLSMNRSANWSLYKSVTILNITNNTANGGDFDTSLLLYNSAVSGQMPNHLRNVTSDDSLMAMLKHDEALRG